MSNSQLGHALLTINPLKTHCKLLGVNGAHNQDNGYIVLKYYRWHQNEPTYLQVSSPSLDPPAT